ncbi:MAG: hypothetical protein ACRD5Z_21380, partial [Bryobacteraceae bacterium]
CEACWYAMAHNTGLAAAHLTNIRRCLEKLGINTSAMKLVHRFNQSSQILFTWTLAAILGYTSAIPL